ncbi:hypothetical protein GGI07_004185 [Coemansia sp. Benny D115]|nr:hypothetical protein GGI07_004185 [Coemansia sp. Benny D115]
MAYFARGADEVDLTNGPKPSMYKPRKNTSSGAAAFAEDTPRDAFGDTARVNEISRGGPPSAPPAGMPAGMVSGFPGNAIQSVSSFSSSGPQPYNQAMAPYPTPAASGPVLMNPNNRMPPQQQQQQMMMNPPQQRPNLPTQSVVGGGANHTNTNPNPAPAAAAAAGINIASAKNGSDTSSMYDGNGLSTTPPGMHSMNKAPPPNQSSATINNGYYPEQAKSAMGVPIHEAAGANGFPYQYTQGGTGPVSASSSVVGGPNPPMGPRAPMQPGAFGGNSFPGAYPGGPGMPPMQQGPPGSNYAPSMGPVPYGRPPYVPSMTSEDFIPGNNLQNQGSSSKFNKVGKYALGALAAGAMAYGVHEFVDGGSSSDEEKKTARRMREERERLKRESEARQRREEEERKRLESHEKQQRVEAEKRQQEYMFQQPPQPLVQMQMQQQQPMGLSAMQKPQYTPYGSIYGGASTVAGSVVGGRRRSESIGSHHDDSVFRPPAPLGRPAYTYDPNDVRQPDPSRTSENSPTPDSYPELHQNPSDTTIKIGTILALKHIVTGRFLHSDRLHSTQTGSNQQLVYAHKWSTGSSDWWQVLPANQDVPVPGSIVNYGNQIRLRHVETGRYLHSHYGFPDIMTRQNEVTCYGDQTMSDENDHWVIERFGDGGYTSTAKSTDAIVLRHYVSGMALHSHDILLSENVQSVTCHGPGGDENDKWRIVLES